jgi:hypothetical protein
MFVYLSGFENWGVGIDKLTLNLQFDCFVLKIAKSVAEAKQFCTTDLDDFDDEEDNFEDFFE